MPGDSGSARRAAMYGDQDLSSTAIFSGHYINFGYWQASTSRLISVEERTESQANLYRTEEFNKCYSVEAAQHFEDLAVFASEVHRVLKPGGRLAVATFFMTRAAAGGELRRLIETIDSGIDVVSVIDSFRDDLLTAGFADVHVESIGEHVWHGFDAWIAQTEFKDGWGRNWLTAYHRGLIDYYLVTAGKQ